jgi:hypothetical protein
MNRIFRAEDDSIGRIHDQLAELSKFRKHYTRNSAAVPVITREQLSNLVETAFWSSLKSNEGRATRAFISVVSPQSFPEAVAFAVPLAFDDLQVSKLAPAVSPGGCLVVHWIEDRFMIWGIGINRPLAWQDAISIEQTGPGIIRFCVGPFQPFAVLDGRSNPIFQGTHSNLAAYLHRSFNKMLPPGDSPESQSVWLECLAMTELARMIVDGGHGGTVLIVPDETGSWMASLSSFSYRLNTPDITIHDATHRRHNLSMRQREFLTQFRMSGMHDTLRGLMTAAIGQSQGDIKKNIRAIASLSAVDGAIVMTQDLRILGFGAKISAESAVPAQVCMFRPEPGTQPVIPSPLENLGGTRHQSAARFAAANKDAVVLVISQDRHMSVVHWHEPINSVAVVRNAEWWV